MESLGNGWGQGENWTKGHREGLPEESGKEGMDPWEGSVAWKCTSAPPSLIRQVEHKVCLETQTPGMEHGGMLLVRVAIYT